MNGNQLGLENSPYLLQHRSNPVHWRAWNVSTLEEAQRLDKPILLSVGYAACHWCHVMAHESFEDPTIADVMNTLFINIKVDREERPDLDMLYQSALAMLGQQGGWPLTMFLTPRGEPFWGGTYFPPTARYGRPGFTDVLHQVAAAYRQQPDTITKNVEALRGGLVKLAAPEPGTGLSPSVIEDISTAALHLVDPVRGGTAGSPKFPQPTFFRFLWRAYKRSGSPLFRDAVTLTLDALCQGGIYDHLGGGFARYATDTDWLVPHFEKMLYDNALLVDLLTEVWIDTQNPLYAQRISETIAWVLTDLRIDDPATQTYAFASAFDADSEGEEGRYYVWDQTSVEQILGNDASLFCKTYGISPGGNWDGHSILLRPRDAVLDSPEVAIRLADCRRRLLAHRRTRVPPLRDDKVLADWNGLMIEGLARAASAFNHPDWLDAAANAFAFVTQTMARHGRLNHTWCRGRAAHPAVLEDYANMARAAVTLYEITGIASYLTQAEQWVAITNQKYWDTENGGYFIVADDTADILLRPKGIADHAVPSGNGVMVEVLARLFYLTGEEAYRQRAEHLTTLFSGDNQRYLLGIPGLLTSFAWLYEQVVQIVICGSIEDSASQLLRRIALNAPNTLKVVQSIANTSLPPTHPAAGKRPIGSSPTAYVCVGQTCSLPITDPSVLRSTLGLPNRVP